jgi:hypothetical protein
MALSVVCVSTKVSNSDNQISCTANTKYTTAENVLSLAKLPLSGLLSI